LVRDPDRPMLHGMDGVLVLYRRVVEAAVLPDGVVRTSDARITLLLLTEP
jgi:hypothetical protein